MKRTVLTIIGVMIAVLTVLAGSDKNKLTVVVKNVPNTKGNIQVSLFDSETNWLEKGTRQVVSADGSTITVIFENIPEGVYAVAVIHDENSNGDLDANFYGMPTEAYGFSNDTRGMFGPASFSESKFELKADKTIEIHIK